MGQGFPGDVIAFCLQDIEHLGWAEGANRNHWLLHTAGSRALSVDDDLIWTIHGGKLTQNIVLQSSRPALPFTYSDYGGAQDASPVQSADMIAQHAHLLGGTLQQGLARASSVDLTRPHSNHLLHSLLTGSGRVRMTFSGLVGDCAFGSPAAWLFTRGENRERLLHNYEQVVTSRDVVMIAPTMTITDHPMCMGYCFALDNTDLVPPFFPIGRNQDGVFGALLRKVYIDTFSGHIPFGLEHRPEPQRTWDRSDVWRAAGEFTFADLLFAFLNGLELPRNSSPCQRMETLGTSFAHLAGQPSVEFARTCHQLALKAAERQIAQLQTRLHEYGGEPQAWASDCQLYMQELSRVMLDPNFGIPSETLPGRQLAAAINVTRSMLHRFGRLLSLWPGIHEYSRYRNNR